MTVEKYCYGLERDWILDESLFLTRERRGLVGDDVRGEAGDHLDGAGSGDGVQPTDPGDQSAGEPDGVDAAFGAGAKGGGGRVGGEDRGRYGRGVDGEMESRKQKAESRNWE